jgi:hypothetical protein
MKIASIEQGHIHRSTLQFLRGVQPGESTPKDQDTMPRRHPEIPFRSNLALRPIISSEVDVFTLIRQRPKQVLYFRRLTLAILCLFPALCAYADSPEAKPTGPSPVAAVSESAPARNGTTPTIVIGFLGGFVRHDDAVHSTVQVAQSLQKDYPNGVRVETFENRRMGDAHKEILRLLGAGSGGSVANERKQAARVILYGHSWGASAVVALARRLKDDGVPVLLTVQVDSVAKAGQNDAIIPDNVRLAANFYQDKGMIHGQGKILAADASRTQILGNFRLDYTANPISCPQYPWYTRIFMRSHIEIECDQHVWQRVENLIREQLPISVARSTKLQ